MSSELPSSGYKLQTRQGHTPRTTASLAELRPDNGQGGSTGSCCLPGKLLSHWVSQENPWSLPLLKLEVYIVVFTQAKNKIYFSLQYHTMFLHDNYSPLDLGLQSGLFQSDFRLKCYRLRILRQFHAFYMSCRFVNLIIFSYVYKLWISFDPRWPLTSN